MKNIIFGLILLFTVPYPALSSAQSNGLEPVVTVVAITGEAEFRREAWSDVRQPLHVGAQLAPTDLVFSSAVEIDAICPDGSRQRFDDLISIDVLQCPQEGSVIGKVGERRLAIQRGGVQRRDVPFLISPRATLVDSPQVVLQWNHVPDAASYTVQLLEDAQLVWDSDTLMSEDVVRGRVAEFVPPLELNPGSSYTVVICAMIGVQESCTSDPGNAAQVNLAFMYRPLDEQQITVMENIAREFGTDSPEALYAQALVLVALPDDDAVEQLAYYSGAIERLQRIGAEHAESDLANSVYYHNLLGTLYNNISLPQSAKAAFDQATALAPPGTESQAQALLGLASVANTVDASTLYEDALKVYAEFLTVEEFDVIRQRICEVAETSACEATGSA